VLEASDSLFEPVYYVSPAVEKTWMDQRVAEAWARRSDRIFPPEQGFRVASKLRALGWKGLLWERLLQFPPEPKGADDVGTVRHG